MVCAIFQNYIIISSSFISSILRRMWVKLRHNMKMPLCYDIWVKYFLYCYVMCSPHCNDLWPSVLLRFSHKSGRPDSAMVPSVRGPHGDETQIYMAHLPVHRILWRAGSDKGDKLVHAGELPKNSNINKQHLLTSSFALRSCIISLATSWIISHHQAMSVRFSLWLARTFIF